jgi:DNA-directed RNA polymerase
MSIELISDYITTKVKSINPNNTKRANSGALLLFFDCTYLDDLVHTMTTTAVQTLQLFLNHDYSLDKLGEGRCKLTAASVTIGEQVARIYGQEYEWEQNVRLGDLFLEALYQQEYIDIRRDNDIDGSPYVIKITDKWFTIGDIPEVYAELLLRGTQEKPISRISSIIQEHKRAVIKGWNKQDQFKFKDLLDTDFIKAINHLQDVPWEINSDVLDVLNNVQDEIPPEIPEEGSKAKADYYEKKLKEDEDDEEVRQKYNEARSEWNIKKNALKLHSKLAEKKFILTKANAAAKMQQFFQYYEADYRGRIYPSESFFSYQGNDMSKSLMLFKEKKPVDQYWLAVHTANSFNMSYDINEIPDIFEIDYKQHLIEQELESISVDKMTLNDRVHWTNAYMDSIIDLGERKEIDDNAEKKFVFLACCIEWFNIAIVGDTYLSGLPIPIDGANNGWQHLGAMSRDSLTGDLVGLTESTIQKDFYVETAKELIKLMPEWFAKRNIPMKHIRKGIAKRGSMTRAYSCGHKKMSESMYSDCYTEGYLDRYNITASDCDELSTNLIKAIDKVCPGPLNTMKYLQKVAAFELGKYEYEDEDGNRITKNRNHKDKLTPVLVEGNGSKFLRWKTLSGFPVKYEAWAQRSVQCKGQIKGVGRISHRGIITYDNPNFRSFASGIAPNFVHSMDASHMAIVIANWPYAFGAVHDSFSTHSCHIEDLNMLIKEVFIAMYDVDNFYNYIEDSILSDSFGFNEKQPDIGNLDITEVNNSDYFFC